MVGVYHIRHKSLRFRLGRTSVGPDLLEGVTLRRKSSHSQ